MISAKEISRKAARAAQCFCDTGCFAGYDCGKLHGQSSVKLMPLSGTGTVCPLAKYGVESWTPKDFFDNRGGLDEDDIFFLCANCEYGEVTEDEDGMTVTRSEEAFRTKCIDCPVQSALECIQENAAEAAMS